MDQLIQIALSFPILIFSGLLALVAGYWLLVALRVLPVEFFERDSLRDDHLSSTLVSLDLGGVPASLALSVLLLLGGVICFALEFFVLRHLPLGFFRVPLGLVVIWASLAMAAPLTVSVCHVIRRRLHRFNAKPTRCLLGHVVEVTSEPDAQGRSRARLIDDPEFEVTLHGKQERTPHIGDRQVLVKYLAEEGGYRSVPRSEYLEASEYLRKLRLRRRHSVGRGRHAH